MRRSILILAGVVLAGMLATPASAQPEALLILNGVSGCSADCGVTLMQVAPTVPAVLSSTVDPDAQNFEWPYVTPDGRLLVWYEYPIGSRPARVGVRDLLSRSTSSVDVPGARGLLGNPARPEVYLLDGAGPFALGPSGMRRFTSPTCAESSLRSMSGDGRRLLSYCATVLGQSGVTLVFDIDSGRVVASLPVNATALNRDGSEVYRLSFVTTPPRLQRFDVATGALQAEVDLPASPFPAFGDEIRVDHRRNRVIKVGSSYSIFDGTSLQLLTTVAFSSEGVSTSIAVDEVDRLIYTTVDHAGLLGAYTSLSVFDADTFGMVVSVPSNLHGWFLARPKPMAPGPLVATVQASAVSLSWSPVSVPATTTRYVLEVGSAIGLSDIFTGLDVGLQTSFAASGVPPGTYYVRVRAGNYAGLSAPSNEVVVVVP